MYDRMTMALLLAWVAACGAPAVRSSPAGGISSTQFQALIGRVATGWSTGDARLAADCFAENAVYEEPPAKQIYRGRPALYAFFGGEEKLPMQMRLHHIAFDESSQTGFAEYTFKLTNQYHGIVVVRVRDGLITHWREYQYQSDLPYDEFARETRFP